MKKLYDLSVKVLDEPSADGERKRRYLKIGMVFDSGKGPYAIIDRTFNPAGVVNPDNKTGVIVNMFEPRSENDDPSDLPF